MAQALTDRALENYRGDGFLIPVTVLTADEAARYRTLLEQAEAGDDSRDPGAYTRQKPHLLYTWCADLVRHPQARAVASSVLGPDLMVWQSSFFCKGAGDAAFVSWHQDAPYWNLEPTDAIVSLWISLTASTRENGCMRMVPGTHRAPPRPHIDTEDDDNMLTRGQIATPAPDDPPAVDILLAPGEACIFHQGVLHCSEPNRSKERRIGFVIRYVAPHARQTTGLPDSAMPVQGEDRYGHFIHDAPPESDLSPEALARYQASLDRRRAYTYLGSNTRSHY
jgi:Phytanoyl-CoA dioxygenase (PhyH)